jgi:hypothetical protein
MARLPLITVWWFQVNFHYDVCLCSTAVDLPVRLKPCLRYAAAIKQAAERHKGEPMLFSPVLLELGINTSQPKLTPAAFTEAVKNAQREAVAVMFTQRVRDLPSGFSDKVRTIVTGYDRTAVITPGAVIGNHIA